jgi:hypothetical protein
MGLKSYDSGDRIDRLALHLGTTARLLQSGAPGVALKDQLIALEKVLLDVVKDNDIKPTSFVQHDVEMSSEPAASKPRPFRVVDASKYQTG